jgi:tryptophan-rich sensory protein
MKGIPALLISLVLAFGAGFVGSFFTAPAIDTWYIFLTKPFFSPPNWIFAPVWTILYALMAVAAWRVWERRATNPSVAKQVIPLYLAHLVVNALWSIAFFGFQAPLAALAIIVLLFTCIAVLIWLFLRIDRTAALLLLPYAAWVLFASALNLAIVLLNGSA